MLNIKQTLILSLLATLPMQVTAQINPAMSPIISFLLSDSSSVSRNTLSGVAVDGYLQGSTVCLDLNADNECNYAEPFTTTDTNGRYSLSYTFTSNAQKEKAQLIVFGGKDVDTDKDFEGQLSANIDNSTDEINITPITTIVANLRKIGKTRLYAKRIVAQMFKLQENELGNDPVSAAKNGRTAKLIAALELQKAIEMIVETRNPTTLKEKRKATREVYKMLSRHIAGASDVKTLLEKAYEKGDLTFTEKESAKVISKIVKDRIDEATKDGKKLTGRELRKIGKTVVYAKVELNGAIQINVKNNIELSPAQMKTIADIKALEKQAELEAKEAEQLAQKARDAQAEQDRLEAKIKAKADAKVKARLEREAKKAQAKKERLEKEAKEAQEKADKLVQNELDAKAEAARVEKQQREQAARKQAQRVQAEKDRLAKIEADKLAAQVQRDRLAAQAERDRLAKIEADKLAAQAQRDRLAAQAQRDRLAAQAERDRLAKIEADRIAKEKADADSKAITGDYTIYVYGHDRCGYTSRMRRDLTAQNIPFNYVNINETNANKSEMWSKVRTNSELYAKAQREKSIGLPVVDVKVGSKSNVFVRPSISSDMKPLMNGTNKLATQAQQDAAAKAKADAAAQAKRDAEIAAQDNTPLSTKIILTKTGQIQSYRSSDDGATQNGRDNVLIRDDSSQIVTDSTTGLMWDDSITKLYKGKESKAFYGAWVATSAYPTSIPQHCSSLTMGGYSDWRVPTKDELLSIVDYSQSASWFLDDIFKQRPAHKYSVTYLVAETGKPGSNQHYAIDFSIGTVKSNIRNRTGTRARCVRSNVKMPTGERIQAGTNVVTDLDTNLMWEDRAELTKCDARISWNKAITKCENLSLAGHNDWRVPNIKEFYSLLKIGRNESPLKRGLKHRLDGKAVTWTSTTIPTNDTTANSNSQVSIFGTKEDRSAGVYSVGMSAGQTVTSVGKTSSGFGRCVRDAN